MTIPSQPGPGASPVTPGNTPNQVPIPEQRNYEQGFVPAQSPPPKRKGVRILVGLLVILIAILIGTIIGGKSNSTQTAAPPSAPSVSPPSSSAHPGLSQSQVDQEFLVMIHQVAPGDTSSDATLLALGHDICTLWSQGDSFAQVVNTARGTGLTQNQIGQVIGLSTAAYCPQYAYKYGG